MKKTFILAGLLLIIPFAAFAHGGSFADADEQTATAEEIQKEQQNHEEMQGFMKKFMVNGSLSEEDADALIVLMGDKMKNDGGMMGMGGVNKNITNESSGGMGEGMSNEVGHGGGTDSGMMGGGMMWMKALHGLVAVTSTLWLVIGVLYILGMRRHTFKNEIV